MVSISGFTDLYRDNIASLVGLPVNYPGGLTGPCLGFTAVAALECAYGRVPEVRSAVNDGVSHFSKLLLRTFYRLLPKDVAPHIVQPDMHPDLVERIQSEFIRIIEERFGLKAEGRFPLEKGKTVGLKKLLEGIRTLAPKLKSEKDSLFFVIGNGWTPLLYRHVVGIHPDSQTLFDSNTGILRLKKRCSKSRFTAMVAQYFKTFYPDSQVQLLHFRAHRPFEKPSGATIIADRLNTAWNMRHQRIWEGPLFLADSIPGFNRFASWVQRKIYPSWSPSQEKLIRGHFSKLFSDHLWARRFSEAIQVWETSRHLFKEIDKLEGGLLFSLPVYSEADCLKIRQFLVDLNQLGAETRPLLQKVASEFVGQLVFSKHVTNPQEHIEWAIGYLQGGGHRRLGGIMNDLIQMENQKRGLILLEQILQSCGPYPGDCLVAPRVSALYQAAVQGNLAAMKLLVQYGGDPFARHYGEETPLKAATGKVKEYLEAIAKLPASAKSPF